VQQLRDGVNNFFVTFIVVLQDRSPSAAKQAASPWPSAPHTKSSPCRSILR